VAMEHTPDRPFGLPPAVVRACYQDAADRDQGVPRYLVFAHNLEVAAARHRCQTDPVLAPIVREFHLLRFHADRLSATLESALDLIDRDPRMDVRPGRQIVSDYKAALRTD